MLNIGSRFCIMGDWDTSEVPQGRLAIYLTPSNAWGVGNHPSTQAFLRALEAEKVEGARVLDLGTGSGILAVAAAKLGASHVACVDIHPGTAKALPKNAIANQVTLQFTHQKIQDVDWAEDSYDLALMNIDSLELITHAMANVPASSIFMMPETQYVSTLQAHAVISGWESTVLEEVERWTLMRLRRSDG